MESERLLRIIDMMIRTIDNCQQIERDQPGMPMKSTSFYCLSELKGCLVIMKQLTMDEVEKVRVENERFKISNDGQGDQEKLNDDNKHNEKGLDNE